MKRFLEVVMAIVLTAAMSLVFGEQTTHSGVGTVQSMDRTKGEVTLKHGPISDLNWPAMTMTFQVKDSRLFDRLQPGKQVAFEFVADGTHYVVTSVIPLAKQSAATPPSEYAHHQGMEMMGPGAMQGMMDGCVAMMKQ
jgi:Cu/Ag efflux protein CusF